MFHLSFYQPIAAAAVRNNVGGADDLRRSHPKGPKNSLLKKIAIELPGYPVDDNSEQHVAGVAVAPFFSRSEAHRHLREGLNQLLLRIVLAEIDHAFVYGFFTPVVGNTRGVGQ